MAATKVSARAIEERIFREYFRHAWNIAAAPCRGSDVAVLLAVDNDQRILGADQIARRLFSLNDEVLNRGIALATIFDYDSSIFRCKRMQDVAARLLRTGSDEPWNALITPPACGMSGLCSPTDALLHSRPRFGMLAHLPLSVDPPTNRGAWHQHAPIAYANPTYRGVECSRDAFIDFASRDRYLVIVLHLSRDNTA